MTAAESAASRPLDELDLSLLRELRGSGRMTISELARRVGAAESTCHKRVGALIESGVITGFRAEVDPAALGLSIEVIISIRVHPHARRSLSRFQAYLTELPESRQVYFLAGDRDFLVHAAVRDTEALRALVSDRISMREEVASTNTSLIFDHSPR